MVESSLSNWDGSKPPKVAPKPAIPTSRKPHMISSPPIVLASPKSLSSRTGALSEALGSSRVGQPSQARDNDSSSDAATYATIPTRAGPADLHFGAPGHILSDPVSASTPAPAWLRANAPSRTQSIPNMWSSPPASQSPSFPDKDHHSASLSRKVHASSSLPSLPSGETAKRSFNTAVVSPNSYYRSANTATSNSSPLRAEERHRAPLLHVYGKPKPPPVAVAGASGTSWWAFDGKRTPAPGDMTNGDELSEDELQIVSKRRVEGSRGSGSRSLGGLPKDTLAQPIKPIPIRTYARNQVQSSVSELLPPPEPVYAPFEDPRDLFSTSPPHSVCPAELFTPPHDPNHLFSPPPSSGLVVRLGAQRSDSAFSITDSAATPELKWKREVLDCVYISTEPPVPKRPRRAVSLSSSLEYSPSPEPSMDHFDVVSVNVAPIHAVQLYEPPPPKQRRWKSPTLTEDVGRYRSPPNCSPSPPKKANRSLGMGEVHMSLAAAINHVRANNERGMPVSTPVGGDVIQVRGRRDERVKKKRKHSIEPKEQSTVENNPSPRKRARKVELDVEASQQADKHPLPICWDVPTAELDRLACANIAMYFFDSMLVETTNTEPSARTELARMPFLPSRVEEDESNISAGPNVRFWESAVVDSPVKEAKRGQDPEEYILEPNQSMDASTSRVDQPVPTSPHALTLEPLHSTPAPAPRPALAPSSSDSEPIGSSLAPTHAPVELPHAVPTTSAGLPAPENPPTLSMKARGKQRADRTPTPQPDEIIVHHIPCALPRPASPQPPPAHQMSDFFNIDPSPNHGPMQISPPHGFALYSAALSATQFVSPASLEHDRLPPNDSLPLFDGPQHYGDGTVDPSLLFGGATETIVETLAEPEEDMRLRSPSPTPSATSSSSSSTPVIAPVSPVRTSGRRPAIRKVPDYLVNTDLLDSDYDGNGSSSSYSGKATPVAKQKSKLSKKPASARQSKSRKAEVGEDFTPAVVNPDRFHRYSGPPWPQVEDSIFCHQCRRRTNYLHMQFDECNHAYCVRCVMLRYKPGTVPFQQQASTEECLLCSGICNCDVCSRRRGDVYVPFRPRSAQIPSSNISAKVPAPPNKTRYSQLEGKLVEPATYYATMYDFNGVAIAQTFLGEDGDTNVLLAQRIPRRRREFIGAVQEEWGLGDRPRVYIEPTPILAAKAPVPGRERYYVGMQSVLSLPVLPRPPPVALPTIDTALQPPTSPPVEVVPKIPTLVSEPFLYPLPDPTSEPMDMSSPLSSLTDVSDRDDDEFQVDDAVTSDTQQPKGLESGQLDCTGEGPRGAGLPETPLVQALPDSFHEVKNAEVVVH